MSSEESYSCLLAEDCFLLPTMSSERQLVPKIWPPSHVLIGTRVCKSVRQQLAINAERVELRPETAGFRRCFTPSEVHTRLTEFTHPRLGIELIGTQDMSSVDVILQGLVQAVESGWSGSLTALELTTRADDCDAVRRLVARSTNLHSLKVLAREPQREEINATRLVSSLVGAPQVNTAG